MNNNHSVKISIIVPCYKVERYLEKCVDSILSSSFKDYEIILVDDGSPDTTGKLADELAQRNDCIKVIHQQNGGVVKAREAGVKGAQGEWITFVDPDDTITPNALEDMYEASVGKDTDIVIGFPVGMKFPEFPKDYGIEQLRADTISGTRLKASLWGRLIHNTIISPFLFDIPREVRLGDDMLFNIRCAFATNKAPIVVKTYVYNYFINEGSITNTNKRDPEYEQYFHEMRMLSIPQDQQNKYIHSIIRDRLHPVQWWSYHNPLDTSWMDSEFIDVLRYDIQNHHYHLSTRYRFLLNQRNKLLRLAGIIYYRIYDRLISKS